MMNVRLLACTILATGLVAGCASSPESGDAVAADDSQTIVCKNTHETGSRLSGRVCKTKAEWGIQTDRDRRTVRNQGRAAQGGTPPAESGRVQ